MLGSDHRLQVELAQLLWLVEVVLSKQGQNLEPPDPAKLRLVQVRLHEEGVANLEALAQRLFRPDLPVERRQHVDDYACTDLRRILAKVAGYDLCARREFDECESSPECVVDEGDAPVSRIHGAKEVDGLWQLEPLAAVREHDVVVAILEHQDELAEDPCQVATVDLVDHDHETVLRPGPGSSSQPFQWPINDRIVDSSRGGSSRTQSFDKVLVAVRGVEHHHLILAVEACEVVAEFCCCLGLASTRRSVEDDGSLVD